MQLMERARAAAVGRFTPAVAFGASLALWWLNVALTTRWSQVPGSIHGAKRPFFLAALLVLTALAVRQRTSAPVHAPRLWRAVFLVGAGVLGLALFRWFPPDAWHQIPFLDNWVPRYQSTIEQVALLRQGAFAGWNWWFLGGYQLSSDLTQSLGVLAFPFVVLAGPELGFHLLHLVLFTAVPLLVYADVRASEDSDVAPLAGALACLLTAGYSFSVVKSGDTNSLAGVCTVAVALLAMQAARQRRWFGPVGVAMALSLAAYTHLGFFAYAVAFCTLHALYYRDARGVLLVAAGVACAMLATLPAYWENWTLRSYFSFNNVLLHPPESFQWGAFARQFYYNVEILLRPGRWFNDYTTPIRIFIPVAAVLALRARGRVGFYAIAALGTLALATLNYAEFGFAFSRVLHLLPVFTAPVLAGFITRYGRSKAMGVALVAAVGLYVQVVMQPVPHVDTLADWNADLVDRIRRTTAGIVLLENSPHLDMIESPAAASPKTPFPAHFEPLVPMTTGRRLYAGFWDGWQWSSFRENLLAAGAMWGDDILRLPRSRILEELERWGIRDVFVWSEPSRQWFASAPEFDRQWDLHPWQHFVRRNADTRQVVTESGSGTLAGLTPLQGRVELQDVREGTLVVIRANHYPAWSARVGGDPVPLFAVGSQMAFRAPSSGTYAVELEYVRRRALAGAALTAFVIALAAVHAGFARRA